MTGRASAVIVAARRTPVAPRGGALAALQADQLAAPVLACLLGDADCAPQDVDQVLLGNALYGGGNPARLAALRAGLPASVPALTVDTQCCSGLDAIAMGARLIEAGAAECVLAGGTESFSRSPLRFHRPVGEQAAPVPYDRPAFAPEPFHDPDLAQAAADLADRLKLDRTAQANFAVSSHKKAIDAAALCSERLVNPVAASPAKDGFSRKLTLKTALRAPVIAGSRATGLSAATIACEADGAAAVLMLSRERADDLGLDGLTVLGAQSTGGDPADPALVPIAVARGLMERHRISVADLAAVELMEAYAVQAMATADSLGLPEQTLNMLGGALARGHPIGASGAILAVQLFEAMMPLGKAEKGAQSIAMALIAAAGGLGAGLLVSRH
ncbi:thiolase family protein [Rhodobacterales bacterium]|nr:thiolase family protein [Rhodobacterales bacterium]